MPGSPPKLHDYISIPNRNDLPLTTGGSYAGIANSVFFFFYPSIIIINVDPGLLFLCLLYYIGWVGAAWQVHEWRNCKAATKSAHRGKFEALSRGHHSCHTTIIKSEHTCDMSIFTFTVNCMEDFKITDEQKEFYHLLPNTSSHTRKLLWCIAAYGQGSTENTIRIKARPSWTTVNHRITEKKELAW